MKTISTVVLHFSGILMGVWIWLCFTVLSTSMRRDAIGGGGLHSPPTPTPPSYQVVHHSHPAKCTPLYFPNPNLVSYPAPLQTAIILGVEDGSGDYVHTSWLVWWSADSNWIADTRIIRSKSHVGHMRMHWCETVELVKQTIEPLLIRRVSSILFWSLFVYTEQFWGCLLAYQVHSRDMHVSFLLLPVCTPCELNPPNWKNAYKEPLNLVFMCWPDGSNSVILFHVSVILLKPII